jgi:hypothetical protein
LAITIIAELNFQTYDSEQERYKEVYNHLLEIILEINLLTKIYNVTKLGFLYDTALSSRHSISKDPNTENLVTSSDFDNYPDKIN